MRNMKKNNFSYIAMLALVCITMHSCQKKSKDFYYETGGEIWFGIQEISLKFDKKCIAAFIIKFQ
jgi:hypothetical protein